MQAKEMFEELGFKEDLYSETFEVIAYRKNQDGIKINIVFNLDYKSWHSYITDMSFNTLTDNLHIDTKIHQAITQQMNELGWMV